MRHDSKRDERVRKDNDDDNDDDDDVVVVSVVVELESLSRSIATRRIPSSSTSTRPFIESSIMISTVSPITLPFVICQ